MAWWAYTLIAIAGIAATILAGCAVAVLCCGATTVCGMTGTVLLNIIVKPRKNYIVLYNKNP